MTDHGVVVIGGHSVDDQEMKFGYAVTGTINPNRVITNAGAKPGDVVILTKGIGTGAINTAVKKGVASPTAMSAAIKAMTTSNAAASKAMVRLGANSCTDVTGFGLLGHAFEMAKASNVTLVVESANVPLLPDVIELIEAGMLTRGDKNNRVYVGDTISIAEHVSGPMQSALFDPQTAGGLLISFPSENADEYIADVEGSRIIGEIKEFSGKLIEVK